MLPGIEKQKLKREEARQRVAQIYNQHPRLQYLAQQIDRLTHNGEILENPQRQTQILNQLQLDYKQYLTAHHIPWSFNLPDYDCQKCHDGGWVEKIDQEASRAYGYPITYMAKCQCLINAEKQHRLARLFVQASLTTELQRQTFNNFRIDVYNNHLQKNGVSHRAIMAQNKDWAMRFVASVSEAHQRQSKGLAIDQRIPWLFLQGPTGVGKTFLCSAIANALLQTGIPVLYLPFTELLAMMKAAFNERNNKADRLLNEARDVEVLILDDLGAENITGFVEETLFSLLNYRLSHALRPTVISSNLMIEEIEDYYNARIASRIKRYAQILDCVGEDLREKFATYKAFKGFPTWK